MKKIVLISIVDVSKKNGQGIYALKTIESICKSNEFKFHLIIPRPTDEADASALSKLVNVTFLPCKYSSRNIRWHLLTQFRIFNILIALGKIDAIIYSVKPTMIGPLLFSLLNRIPLYVLVEGLTERTLRSISRGLTTRTGLLILRTNIKKARKVYPAYHSAKQWVDSLRNDEATIIPCGVDCQIFKEKQKSKTDILTIGYVGSFRKVHLLRELILSSVNFNLRIYLVGDGEERPGLVQLVDQLCVADKVIFLGIMRQEELKNIFSECDVMWAACNDLHWGIPIKCFEYLACNKKVIYTDCEDLSFIKENGYGFCINSSNVDSIKNILQIIAERYRNGLLSDNSSSREYILRSNTWEAFREIILKEINAS